MEEETQNQETTPPPKKEEETQNQESTPNPKVDKEEEVEAAEEEEEKQGENKTEDGEEEEEEKQDKKKKRKKAQIAVVGCGWWSQGWHIPHLLRNSDKVIICALVNKDDQPTSTLNENLLSMTDLSKLCGNCPTYKSVKELMNDYMVSSTLNGVIICTPHSTHYEIAETLIQEGMNRIIMPSSYLGGNDNSSSSSGSMLHILLEKPMTTNVKEAQKLHELAHCYWRTCRNAFPNTNTSTNTTNTNITPTESDADADCPSNADADVKGEDAEGDKSGGENPTDDDCDEAGDEVKADASAEGESNAKGGGDGAAGPADIESGGKTATGSEIGDADANANADEGGEEDSTVAAAADADAHADADDPYVDGSSGTTPPKDHTTTATTTTTTTTDKAVNNTATMPYFQLNHSANFRKQTRVAKDLIQNQKMIGKIRHINASMASPLSWLFGHPKNWNWNQPTQEGMLGNGFAWGQSSHLLAWIYHVAGDELIPLKVFCIMNHSETSGADLSHSATIKCRNDITFSLAGTCLLPGNEHGDPPIGKEISIEIYGSDGALFYRGNDHDPTSGRLEIRMGKKSAELAAAAAGEEEVAAVEGLAKTYCDDLGFHFENTDQEGLGPESLQTFIAACCGETDTYEGANTLVGLKSIQTLDAMYRSHHSGAAEDIQG